MVREDWRERARRLARQRELQQIDAKGLNHRGRVEAMPTDVSSRHMFVAPKAERAVVGAILMDPTAMGDIVDIVQPEDFATEPSAVVYRAMAALWEQKIPATLVTVSDMLDNELAATELAGLMAELQGGEAAYVVYYAKMVASQAQRRRFVEATERAIIDLYQDGALEVEPVVSRVMSEVAGSVSLNRMGSVETLMDQTIEAVTMEMAGAVDRPITPSPFKTLDAITGGWAPQDLIVLAARSSMGKTSMASDWLQKAAEVGAGVFFSAEMGADSVLRRMASRISGVSMQKLQLGDITEEEYRQFMAAAQTIQGWPLYIDDTPAITTDQMLLRVQRIQMEQRVSLVVFDYLEMIGDDVKGAENANENTHQRLTEATKKLKTLARVCEVPVVVLSQVSRGIDARSNKVPMLSDLRWTGMLEQMADKVIMMYAHDYYVKRGFEAYDANREGIMEVYVAKNRNGPEGMVRLGYDPQTFRFWEV